MVRCSNSESTAYVSYTAHQPRAYGVGFSVCLMGRILPHSLEQNL